MVKSRSIGSRILYAANVLILFIFALSCIYPFWYTFSLSISRKSAANAGLVTFYPIGFTLSSYKEIISDIKFFNSFWISIQRTVLGTSLSLLVAIMMAYPLSKTKKEFKARNIFMWILIFCMLFNGGLIPWYITVKSYKLLDTIWALVLGGSVPVFNVILLMNFFRNFPDDIEEAAIIDGSGPWRTLFTVIVPCSFPAIATVTLFSGVYHWNEFFNGLVLMSNETKYPLQTYIQQLVVNIPTDTELTPDQYKRLSELSNKSLDAAKVFISIIPMLVVYPFLQKYFVSGIMLGAVKE